MGAETHSKHGKRKAESDSTASNGSGSASAGSESILLDRLSAPVKKAKTVTVENLAEVENAIDMLGKAVRTIIDLTPDIYSHSNKDINSLLMAPKIKLAQHLTSLPHLGVLSKVEQLVSHSQGTLKSAVPFSSLSAQTVKSSANTSSSQGADSSSRKETQALKNSVVFNSRKEVKNRSKQVSKWPPPLPEITDPKLETQVYTHKSVASLHTHLTGVELLDVHNERLEFLGDSIVNSLIAVIAYDRFPYMHEGDLSNIRRALITNNIMAEWAILYGMDKKLKFYGSSEQTADVVGGRGQVASTPKYVADTFEAFVGGVWVNYGGGPESVAIVRPWLEKLVDPMIRSIERAQEGAVPLDYEAKLSLYTKIGSENQRPNYVTVKALSTGTVIVECRMGDTVLATGHAGTAKEAGLRAAMKVLQQPDTLNKYAMLRREVPRVLPADAQVSAPATTPATSSNDTGNAATPSKTQLEFIKNHEAEFSASPKKYLRAHMGSKKESLRYENIKLSTPESGEPSAKPQFESTLYLNDTKLSSATGSSAKSADKRAAFFALTQNIDLINEFLKT